MPLMIAVEYSAKESNACPWEDSDAHTPHHSAAIPQKDSSHLVGAEIWLHLRRLRSLAAVRFATPRRLHPQGCPDRSRRNTGQAFAPACLLSVSGRGDVAEILHRVGNPAPVTVGTQESSASQPHRCPRRRRKQAGHCPPFVSYLLVRHDHFLGLRRTYALSSALLAGVGNDATFIADHIAARQ
jgi:hypothetical protein